MVILSKLEVLVMMIMMKIRLLQHKMLPIMLHKFKIRVFHLLLKLWVPWPCWARSLRGFKIRSGHGLILWVSKLPLWIAKLALVDSMMSLKPTPLSPLKPPNPPLMHNNFILYLYSSVYLCFYCCHFLSYSFLWWQMGKRNVWIDVIALLSLVCLCFVVGYFVLDLLLMWIFGLMILWLLWKLSCCLNCWIVEIIICENCVLNFKGFPWFTKETLSKIPLNFYA